MKTAVKAILSGIGTSILLSGVFLILLPLFINLNVDLRHGFYRIGFPVLYILHYLTFLSFMLIGFVTAKIARKGELVYGFILGTFLFLSFSAFSLYINAYYSLAEISNMLPLYYLIEFYSTPLSIVGCMTGAYIQKRIRNKERKESLENKIEDLGKK